ncbi:(2Fe-2S)-binding protein [Lysinibacillus macroides]|uniref:BFD-like [2Fe-2S]-binding domain-containing protein n=1 Tax=Lysinibacillus macroides TaxID=33935 RepID=A0A0M9DNZ5_9BACI|nr:(2Fe-2S)-binding protein [Lysinibacillus macroides]KOY84032.1 hypothetical protein ADM90_01060 [Lysinibacillus macroides]QPR66802.1 (2Fe-2S)-binding protein [Lysinibacillus macroides]
MKYENPTIICRCENITLEEIEQVVSTFRSSVREVKMRTRAGMGPCGGRICKCLVEQIVTEYHAHSLDSVEQKVQVRPPVRPISFGELGDLYEK